MALNKDLLNVKKKPKREKEASVKQSFTKALEDLCEMYDLPLTIDWPGATQYGTQGRPDAYVYIASYHCMVEIKSETGLLSPTQKDWHDRYHNKHGNLGGPGLFMLRGKRGIPLLLKNISVALTRQGII